MPRLRRLLGSPRALGLAAVLLALTAILIVVLTAGGSSTPSAAPPAAARSAPLESIFEADNELHADPEGTLKLLRRLGVTRVRVFVPWGLINGRPPIAPAPLSPVRPQFDASDPAAYPPSGWAAYDPIVRDAAALGIGLDFTLAGPAPVWATRPGEPAGGPVGNWMPSARQFGAFVRAVATRYSGHYPDPARPGARLPRVGFWAIWNEPNFGIDLAPQAVDRSRVEVSPRLYRGLLDAAWRALQATSHGHDTILIGELAPRGQTLGGHPGNFDGMVPLRFLRALYCVDSAYTQLRGDAARSRGCPASAAGSERFAAEHPALFHATGFSDHPYPQNQPPDVPTPDEPEYADFPVLSRLESTLDRLQRVYGSRTRFPIYSTEFGYLTTPPERLFRAASPQTAARYLNWAEYLSWRDPRIRSYDQYLLADPSGGNFPNGVWFADRRPKAGYFAYRFPLFLPTTSGRRGQALEVWGCARPIRYAPADSTQAHRVEIQFRAPGARSFRAIRTVQLPGHDCYFDVRQPFPSSGSVRLKWSYPGGPAIVSRTAEVDIR